MRIDHVAHLCRDPRQTHGFYTQIMGFNVVQAYAGAELLLVYALPDGGSLAFSASRQYTPESADSPDHVTWERQHVGLTVASRAEYETWLKRLKEFSVPHRVVDDERIYLADPDGLVLELEVESPMPVDPNASDILRRWVDSQ